MAATRPRIITRAEWEANPLVTPAGTISIPTEELWLHHTAGSQFGAAGMRMLQQYAIHGGYVDLEYSFVYDDDNDTIFESRGVGRNSAATGGKRNGFPWPAHNSISHAICVMGNFQNDPVSARTIETLANLVAWGYEQGWWPLGFTGGHRDASGNSTACPGDHLEAVIPAINARAAAIHTSQPEPPPPPPIPINIEEEDEMYFILTATGRDAALWKLERAADDSTVAVFKTITGSTVTAFKSAGVKEVPLPAVEYDRLTH